MSDPQSVADLYQQVLGRTPESDAVLGYWNQQFGDSIDPNEVAAFQTAARPELSGGVNAQYQQNFGRQGEDAGIGYWQNKVNTGELGSLSQLQNAIRTGAQGWDVAARDDKANFATAWQPDFNINGEPLWYNADADKWSRFGIKKQKPELEDDFDKDEVDVGAGGGNNPGGNYDPNTSYLNTGVVNTAVPDLTGQKYGPGTGTGSPTLGEDSGWGWRPDLGTWAGSRTGTVSGPVPYKTTDASGKVVRSWGLAAHPWDKATTEVPVIPLPKWDAPTWDATAQEAYRPGFAHGGSVPCFDDGGSVDDFSLVDFDSAAYEDADFSNWGDSGSTEPVYEGVDFANWSDSGSNGGPAPSYEGIDFSGWVDSGSNGGPAPEESVVQDEGADFSGWRDSGSNGGPAPVAPEGSGFMGALDSVAKMLEGPGGRLALSGLGGVLSYMDAAKKNKLIKEAQDKQAKQIAANKAEQAIYGSPLRLAPARTRLDKPEQRKGGEAVWFSNNKLPSYFAHGGSANYVQGGATGQSDKVEARLSPGEYVFDADAVAALGDGNNAAGAKVLDNMRENIRQHKRSAPASKIPPKAKSPLAYMKGKK